MPGTRALAAQKKPGWMLHQPGLKFWYHCLGSDGDTFGSQEENYLRFGDKGVTPVTVTENIRKKAREGRVTQPGGALLRSR